MHGERVFDRVRSVSIATQTTFFGLDEPSFDACAPTAARVVLSHGAWIEYFPGWLRGDQALFDDLSATVDWQTEERAMYDRMVQVPRLTASLPRRGAVPPVLRSVGRWLSATYAEPFRKISLAWYRDERDSVAPHGDQIARDLDTSVMATLSIGALRRFTLSPVQRGADPVSLELGSGDLLVMGGTVQRTWRHGIPKSSRPVGPRMAVMFRPPWLG